MGNVAKLELIGQLRPDLIKKMLQMVEEGLTDERISKEIYRISDGVVNVSRQSVTNWRVDLEK